MLEQPPEWWDPYSSQPYKLESEAKPRLSAHQIAEYAKVSGAALLGAVPLLLKYLTLRKHPCDIPAKQFVGLSVSPLANNDNELVDLVAELGIENLLVRIPCWESHLADEYQHWMEKFEGCRFVVNVLQSRNSVQELDRWRRQLTRIAEVFVNRNVCEALWIGNAINRTKWGCRSTRDYLNLQSVAQEIRSKGIKIIGSSVIDFEPLPAWRTVFNFADYHLDAMAAELYVNRRHSPWNTQYGVFDLENKLRLFKAMASLGNRCSDELWVTETNWPLLDTKPYTPNSGHPSRTVDETTQAAYLKLYYQLAWQTGWVKRVYWWQLVNPGYGLVDSRGDRLRKMPSFEALKQLMMGELQDRPRKP
ncbi:MAG: hypothetical protein HOM55_10730 [Proteobacteria bacterium]|jgi:hypothetical protein|nr:hypothetical protein [Pseudomonadota bacterium]